jgi:hypothetical protein
VSARATALAFALLGIGLTVAQDALPAREWYHGWEYVTILAIAIGGMIAHAARAWRGSEANGKRLAIALAGATAVSVAGLLSGLIGPDDVTVVGTPGTVTPVADLGAAAFFPPADPQAIARGAAVVTLRRRNAPDAVVGARPAPAGLWVAFAQSRPAAYVEVRDDRGERLTITQPSNPSFLSPVLLFRQGQEIHGRTFPLDTFAVPAVHRIVRALYFTPADLATFPRDPSASAPREPSAILTVADDAGKSLGITMAPSGRTVAIAGLHVTVTLGTYPVLQLASAPQPLVTLGGILLFLIAGAWSLAPRKTAQTIEPRGTPPCVIPSPAEGPPPKQAR